MVKKFKVSVLYSTKNESFAFLTVFTMIFKSYCSLTILILITALMEDILEIVNRTNDYFM